MTDEPVTLIAAGDALRAGDTTSVALVEAALERADALDELLGVYLARFDDYALARARAADADFAAGVDRGLLQGIPVGVKDILAMAEGPTTGQSLVLDPDWGNGKDAVVVERLKASGAVITGKLSATELASGLPDPEKPFPLPRNPWDTDTWPGGSSSGAAAGVAAGMFLAALGSDTGGSIRMPASFCGVSGLMPTFGRVPSGGCVPLGFSLDHIGPLARSAADCGAVLAAIAGADPRDPYSVELPVEDYRAELNGLDGALAGLRLGVERANHLGMEGADPAVEAAFEATVETLESLDATAVEVVIPNQAETVTAGIVTGMSEAFAYHRADLRSRREDFTASNRTILPLGACFSGADYVQAQRVRRVTQRSLASLFADVDAVVMPAASVTAPTYEHLLSRPPLEVLRGVHTFYWSAVGNPALVVPMGFNDDGLPLGLQIAARPFEESLLVRVGDAYQRATDWHLRVPAVSP